MHCRPWSFANRVLLVGDAAHAIVPFHGQGMNAAFEDCVVLDELTAKHESAGGHDWPAIFAAFEAERAPNARAIAEMALENYREMRDEVRDAKFELRAALSFELERRFPGRFIPRYSMVMFHPEIPYAEAQRRGALQSADSPRAHGSADTFGRSISRARDALVERAVVRRLARFMRVGTIPAEARIQQCAESLTRGTTVVTSRGCMLHALTLLMGFRERAAVTRCSDDTRLAKHADRRANARRILFRNADV